MSINEQGIYKGVSIEEYHSSEGISSSGISLIIPPNCPKLYWHRYLSGHYKSPSTSSFSIGSAVHTMVLEPEEFDNRYAICPAVDRRTKIGKETFNSFLDDAEGREVLTDDQYNIVCNMSLSVTSHRAFKGIVDSDDRGNIEDSISWIDQRHGSWIGSNSGALLRSRPDFYNESIIMDIKTTRDVRSFSFSKSIADYGYHRQAAMACDGLSILTGRKYTNVILFVVSKEPPHLIKSYVLSSAAVEEGRRQYKEGAMIYKKCLDDDEWPGYDEIIEDIELPYWCNPHNGEGIL